YEPKRIILNADKDRIAQVISNLLSNAVKFTTKEKGTIYVTAERKNSEAIVSEAIVIVDEEEENNKKSKEETPSRDEGIKDELKEETRVIQDLEQGDEDIEEEDIL
ncbi:MAG TPA: ATP-binding protein, partial [Nitrososphaeraceae archaeon]